MELERSSTHSTRLVLLVHAAPGSREVWGMRLRTDGQALCTLAPILHLL
jgi:hypothetical protein